ncbi:hypothetical protein LR48_Vigan03g076500 [Vigna angularis]|uniref:Uncharacterized protein n=1 Tax=Phaseolus angularis TaxID=3914 RepID=A0A0L9U3I3_PHAAN|nr:hypothetical protein LR48_Vigan03g076500 [Vigna angularis]
MSGMRRQRESHCLVKAGRSGANNIAIAMEVARRATASFVVALSLFTVLPIAFLHDVTSPPIHFLCVARLNNYVSSLWHASSLLATSSFVIRALTSSHQHLLSLRAFLTRRTSIFILAFDIRGSVHLLREPFIITRELRRSPHRAFSHFLEPLVHHNSSFKSKVPVTSNGARYLKEKQSSWFTPTLSYVSYDARASCASGKKT